MIVTADWVLPISTPPIEDGAVAIREGRVVEVGSAADVCCRWLDDPVESLDGCILAPGLVNAHTHLALTVAHGLVPSGAFHPWLAQVTKIVLGLSHEEFGDSAAGGALECIRSGTTCVGDIVYGLPSLAGATAAGLGGVFFWEVLGLTPDELLESLERRGYPPEPIVPRGSRVRVGLSPHAPYSSGPELIRATRDLTLKRGEPFVIHVSEAAGEVELVERGTGPFTAQAERLAHGFDAPGTTPVAYLDSLGVLDGATCIHAVQVTAEDIALLAEKARAVVLCPRSNAFLENGTPPVALLRESGVRLAVGTDSSASNSNLDLFAELRAVAAIDPGFSPEPLLQAATAGGATALELDGVVGVIAPGVSADLTAVRGSVEPGGSPAQAFLDAGYRGDVSAVMGAGEWLVRDGKSVLDTAPIETAAAAARAHAIDLLGGRA